MNRFFFIPLVLMTVAAPPAWAQQSSPYCRADLVFDNTLDFFDMSSFLSRFSDGDLSADFNDSGNLNFFDISAFLEDYLGGCPDLTDSDGDRLPDFVETDTGTYHSVMDTGTDPLNPDTDGDHLTDGDEVLGTVEGLVLPNASPFFRDIFIECDWHEGVFSEGYRDFRPTAAVEARIGNAFFNASTPNPYGSPDGVLIHLDYGQGGLNSGGNRLPGTPTFITFDSDFNAYKAANFDPRRKGYYHYAIFTNRYNSGNNGSSGVAEINGDDLIVSLVNFNSTTAMANTLAHELGHNLGLLHGGFENRNYKPNYNSVMNYRHQFPGVDTTGNSIGNGLLDYSRGDNIDLDEGALLEARGVTGALPIDWNRDGVIDPDPISANINCSSPFVWEPCGTAGDYCADATCSVLRDHDDWNSINWACLEQSADRQGRREISECDNWPGK